MSKDDDKDAGRPTGRASPANAAHGSAARADTEPALTAVDDGAARADTEPALTAVDDGAARADTEPALTAVDNGAARANTEPALTAVESIPPSRTRTPPAFESIPPSRTYTPPAIDPVPSDRPTVVGTEAPILQAIPLGDTLARGGTEELATHHVGRFALLRQVGAGAMGVVYAGYDDILERKVAIKLLLPRETVGTRAQKRMLREAQALAKLRHPNVVQIYDVGFEGNRIFIAMEFVTGQTLRQWASERGEPHPWRDVLGVYAQAGRALAAAHAAGLVHRDFKPDNAMLGSDGVVRVMDFGLALTGPTPSEQSQPSEGETPAPDPNASGASSLVGTPAYMAPEQWGRGIIDARTDQFSFCVALFEALWGRHPFDAPTLASRAAAVIEGRIHDDFQNRGVPDRVRRAIRRGLSTDPADRWPSMPALLDALAEDRGWLRRWRWSLLGVSAVTIGLGGWAIARQASRDRCAKIAQQVDQAWTPARRHKVHDALLGSRPEQTGTMAAHVVEVLDRYAEQLREGRRDACEATLVQDEQPEAVMVKRLRCLDIRQHQLDAHVELLEQADPAIVERSIDLAHELGPVRPCANPQTLALEAAPPDDPTARAEVEQIRDGLARVRALTIAGRYTQAHTQTDDWLARARASGHDPVLIEALNERARTSLNVDAHDQALALAREAYVLSDRGARPAAVETLLVMGRALGVNGHLDAALLEYRRALALQRQIEPQPTAKEGELLNLIGMTLSSLERKDEALDHFERARAIWLDIGDSSETVDAAALGNIANLHVDADQLERGIAEWEQVLAIRTEHLGPHHLRVAIAHNNYAFALEHANRYTDANTHYARAIAIIESMPDSEHTLARLHDNIGHNLHMQGRLDEAMRALTRARQIYASRPDSNPAYVAANLQHLGQVTRQTGPLDDALAYFRRALEIRRGIFGPDHPALASQHHGIGRVLLMQGDAAAALTEHRAALDLQSELTPPHRALATTHAYIGIALLSTGRASDALTELEQAHSTLVALGEERQHRALTVLRGLADVHLALRDTEAAVQWATTALDIASEQHSPLAIASGQFTLATVLWSVDRSRAEALLAEAEASMRSMGTTTDFQRLSQWKASHP